MLVAYTETGPDTDDQRLNARPESLLQAEARPRDFPGGWSVICDFDGTITPFDVTDALLTRFAAPEWEAVEAAWVRGDINSRQCMERQVALLDVAPAELDAYLDTVPVDGDFPSFVGWCQDMGIGISVLSDGLDYAITRILSRHGLCLPVTANRLVFLPENRYALDFPHGAPECGSGVCKCRAARKEDGRLLLIGDGRSDFCFAERAEFVLAKKRRTLLDFCSDKTLPHQAYTDFREVRALFESWA
ncbi:MAG: HAD-IB family phosphatase [Desulfovibrio sp.]|jgi:2,3-diketo-5-methylthio-1-phosphopentane phosphatase|nr:HAD-IB family phosphatase [Desulfovibrio sp.]